MAKDIIKRNFSRYASTYDRYADVQIMAAQKLIAKTGKDSLRRILEIGCGTGNYTQLLREKFKNAQIKALDISDEMINMARRKLQDKKVEFITADAESIDLDEKFDLVTSNACFQWFEDVEKAVTKYKYWLNDRGVILFSLFGPLTFWELNSVLKYILGSGSIEAAHFPALEKMNKILSDNFRAVETEEVSYLETFISLVQLLKKIKYSGAMGNGLFKSVSFSPFILKNLERHYLSNFKQIRSTYQVFFCKGAR